VITFTYGNRTNAEMKIILHRRMVDWMIGNHWIVPMAELSPRWEPVHVFIFLQAKNPDWKAFLLDFMSQEEVKGLEVLAADHERKQREDRAA
jgi:hypothetical protein